MKKRGKNCTTCKKLKRTECAAQWNSKTKCLRSKIDGIILLKRPKLPRNKKLGERSLLRESKKQQIFRRNKKMKK
jgi:hypothetical protein